MPFEHINRGQRLYTLQDRSNEDKNPKKGKGELNATKYNLATNCCPPFEKQKLHNRGRSLRQVNM